MKAVGLLRLEEWLMEYASEAGICYVEDTTGLFVLETNGAAGERLEKGGTIESALDQWASVYKDGQS